MFSFIRSINKNLSQPQSVDQEVESHLQKTKNLGKSFERRGAHGYGKKKIFQPKEHKKYELSARTPKKKVEKNLMQRSMQIYFLKVVANPLRAAA